ncbi:MAG TPA: OmpA family protein [Saprospiraceae bacterium]|nr:OmpA family protein [Saprospiraceae bacterium]HMQ82237.1 OmpA family protein [Saprospiraceae bacterium]
MRLVVRLMIVFLALGTLQSCVSKKKYDELLAAKEATDAALAEAQANLKTLEEEKNALEADLAATKTELNGKIADLSSKVSSMETQMGQIQQKLTMTESELKALKDEINGIFGAYANSGLKLEDRDGRLYVVTSEPIGYSSGSVRLSKSEKDALKALAETLKNNPNVQILIEGHADSQKMVEGAAYRDNWDLSVARANEVVRYLVKNGASPSQLTIAGRGDTMPAGDNKTSEGRASNRRSVVLPNPNLGGLMKGN